MEKSLGQQTIKGIGWSAIERFSVQGVTFIIQIILARLLSPSDYGMVAMLAIFLQIAQVFIDSGFANALIKKQDCSDIDYSTVFYYNLAVSLFLYLCLFTASPFIASFYDTPQLTSVLRVLALTLVFNALSIVQFTQLVKRVDFKSQSIVTFVSALTSGLVGVYIAYKGLGVWALVYQQLLNSILKTFLLFLIVKWRPSLRWSNESFKYVFNFGSKLLVTSLIETVYKNLYKLVIGKRFSERELGFYSRAEEFAIFPSNNLANIIARVSFPVLSKIQDDNERLSKAYRLIIRYSSWIIFPLMIGLLAVAEPFIIVVLTEKWRPAVLILQILCLDWMLDYLCVINLNLLFVKGRTDLVLKLQIVKKIIAVSILFISIPFGLISICVGRVLYSVIAVCINTYYTKRIINLGIVDQMKDVLPFLLTSLAMGVCVYLSCGLIESNFISLIVGIITGAVIYSLFSLCFFKKDIVRLLHIKQSFKNV